MVPGPKTPIRQSLHCLPRMRLPKGTLIASTSLLRL
ncbi:unnamed protein product [Rhodiola kirilowii]